MCTSFTHACLRMCWLVLIPSTLLLQALSHLIPFIAMHPTPINTFLYYQMRFIAQLGLQYRGKFSWGKISRISLITGYSRKYYPGMSCFLLTKIRAIELILRKYYSRNPLSRALAKIFSPENFPLYGMPFTLCY